MPDYNFLSAPLWLITTLHVITLTLHFLAMNFIVGGIIVVLWGKFDDRFNDVTVHKFIGLFPSVMALTITLGVAPLLFVQLVYHRQVYAASIVSGWFWLMIIAAVIFVYYFLYAASFSKKASNTTRGWFLTLALIGMFYVAFVYSSVFTMAERPNQYADLYARIQSGLAINPHFSEYIFRWLHMLVGAVAVGGFFIGLLGRNNSRAFEVGKKFFLHGTIGNAVIGFVYLFTLGNILRPFMRSPGIWFLTVGIILAFATLHFFFKRRFVIATSMLSVSMLTMVVSRHFVRLIKLGAYFEPTSLPVRPQWSIFFVFLIAFVAALATVYYMLKLYFGGKRVAAD